MIVNRVHRTVSQPQAAGPPPGAGFGRLLKRIMAELPVNRITLPVGAAPPPAQDLAVAEEHPLNQAQQALAQAGPPSTSQPQPRTGRGVFQAGVAEAAPVPSDLLADGRLETVLPAPSPLPARAIGGPVRATLSRQEIDRMIHRSAKRHGLSPSLVKAVALAESGLDPLAESPRGARGLMQLMPETAEELGVDQPFDPAQNVEAGCRYLKRLLKTYQGDLELALAAYNWGQGRVDRLGLTNIPAETRTFLGRVKSLLKVLEGRESA